MTRVDVVVETPVSASARARQLEGMFDVPRRPVSRSEWHGEVPLDAEPWNVGLIVGPSGAGKSTVARKLFGERPAFDWGAASVIDDFPAGESMESISGVCQAVGFNTIPAWLRPYGVLSTGERFRAELARHLLSHADPIVVDEFTSVVDRQVAKIGAHAVQKHVRRANRRFVAVSCHYDVVEWLQPDWVLEPATWSFTRRLPQRRPPLECSISQVSRREAWPVFAPFHYLTSELHTSARCFVLFVEDEPAAFTAVLNRPTKGGSRIMGESRTVTLPDWQGLGLAHVLVDRVASLYVAMGWAFHSYPSHPAFVRARDRSPNWQLLKRPGRYAPRLSSGSKLQGKMGGRPNAVFRYVGAAASQEDIAAVFGDSRKPTMTRRLTPGYVASRAERSEAASLKPSRRAQASSTSSRLISVTRTTSRRAKGGRS